MKKKDTLKDLKISDIKKNNRNNISYTIKKIKANEKKAMFITVCFMMIVIVIVALIVFSSFDVGNSKNILDKYKLTICNDKNISITGNLVSLNESNILPTDSALKMEPLIFKVNNASTKGVNFKALLKVDNEVIRECGCEQSLVDSNNIKFKIDNSTIFVLADFYDEKENAYDIFKGYIDAKSSKEYKVYIWIDNNMINNYTKSHFHGNIFLDVE